MKTDLEVLNFIKQFRELDASKCFLNGMCYYFTVILERRFAATRGIIIMYDQVMNHFATKIDNRIYDISGDVTDDAHFHWEPWRKVQETDALLTERIIRDCIQK